MNQSDPFMEMVLFIPSKDVQQLDRNIEADCLDLSDGGDGFHGAGTLLRPPRSPREGEGDAGGKSCSKFTKCVLKTFHLFNFFSTRIMLPLMYSIVMHLPI